jgi:quercetin dioxygenase-like cupin family protein
MFPFNEVKINNHEKIRTFRSNVKSDELVWHRDRYDRTVEVISGSDWLFQLEGCLPIPMNAGDVFQIPAETYHRIGKGSTDLILRITE